MPRVPVNPVWNYFEIHNDGSFKCLVDNCEAGFSPPVNTTNAKRHLKRFHSGELSVAEKLEAERKVLKAIFAKPITEVVAIVSASVKGLEEVSHDKDPMEHAISQPMHCKDSTLTGPSTCTAPAAEPERKKARGGKVVTNAGVVSETKRIACKELFGNQHAEQPVNVTNNKSMLPKRKAAIKAMERVRAMNQWIAQMKQGNVVKAKRTKRIATAPNSIFNAADEEFPVEEILDERYKGGTRQLLIKWLDWDDNYNSWEPITNVDNCDALLRVFEHGMDEGFEELDED